ncbi:MAG: hypothetical protein M3463_20460 [Verrucomicrobiota bacterium]|nr:hypothetical protein [Verrucomicrobiota bacterium]
MDAPRYQRLPGSGLRAVLSTRSTLWLAPDHLLSLDRTVGSESYRRFYFRDIEALVIRRTNTGLIRNWTYLGLALLCGLPLLGAGLWAPDQTGWFVAASVASGFWLLLLLINALRGPTCRTHIRTAVQIEELPSLGRLSTAIRTIARIKPLIEEAQGELTRAAIDTASWVSAASLPAGAPIPTGAPASPKPLRHETGRLHAALFTSMLVWGLISFAEVLWPSNWLLAVDLLFGLLTIALLIFALQRQPGSDLPRGARTAAWSVLVYNILGFFIGLGYAVAYPLRHGGAPPPDATFFFRDEPGYLQVVTAAGFVAIVVGLAGLFSLSMRAHSMATSPVPAPEPPSPGSTPPVVPPPVPATRGPELLTPPPELPVEHAPPVAPPS